MVAKEVAIPHNMGLFSESTISGALEQNRVN